MKVVALKRIQRRDADGRRVAVPTGGVFEIEAESAEHRELRKLNAIRPAKASDIELAKENPKLRIKGRMKRVRTIKELRAIKAAKEFAAENPDMVDPPGASEEEQEEQFEDDGDEDQGGAGGDEGNGGGEDKAPAPKAPVAAPKAAEKPAKGKGKDEDKSGKKRNLV